MYYQEKKAEMFSVRIESWVFVSCLEHPLTQVPKAKRYYKTKHLTEVNYRHTKSSESFEEFFIRIITDIKEENKSG